MHLWVGKIKITKMLFNITNPGEGWILQKAFNDVHKVRYNKLKNEVQILFTWMQITDSYFFTKAIAIVPILSSVPTISYKVVFWGWSEYEKVPPFLATYLSTDLLTNV